MEKLSSNNLIIFSIDEASKLTIKPSIALQELTCCDESSVFLMHQNQKYILSNGKFEDTQEHLLKLQRCLAMALCNELFWNKQKNIQLPLVLAHYNFFIMDKKKAKLHGVVFDEEDNWVGYKYLLWSNDYAAWMYNDQERNIILEITSAFHPQYYYNKQGKTRYTEYHDFIKNCTSSLTFYISREMALKWLQLTKKYIQLSEGNIAYHSSHKEKD